MFRRECVIWLKADIKENPKWWVCGECTRLRVRVADRVLLLCMSGAFWSVLSLFVSFCRLLSIFLDFGFTGGFDTFLALSALFLAQKIYFPDLVSFRISDFEEGGAAELGGGATLTTKDKMWEDITNNWTCSGPCRRR